MACSLDRKGGRIYVRKTLLTPFPHTASSHSQCSWWCSLQEAVLPFELTKPPHQSYPVTPSLSSSSASSLHHHSGVLGCDRVSWTCMLYSCLCWCTIIIMMIVHIGILCSFKVQRTEYTNMYYSTIHLHRQEHNIYVHVHAPDPVQP